VIKGGFKKLKSKWDKLASKLDKSIGAKKSDLNVDLTPKA